MTTTHKVGAPQAPVPQAVPKAQGLMKDPVAAGRKGGLKSGQARAEKAAQRADLRARLLFENQAERVAQELLNAALGEGEWSRDGQPILDAKERVAILKTCLEYGVGRPRPQDPKDPQGTNDEAPTGIKFGVRAPTSEEPETQ